MKAHAQAVVIAGGVIGCSILYHIAKQGWTDVVLLERSELTSGPTWHAAANIHGLHDSINISLLQQGSRSLAAGSIRGVKVSSRWRWISWSPEI